MLDFTKLLEEELDSFLKFYIPDVDDLTYNRKILLSEELFNKLNKNPLSLYPYSVLDLYIASKGYNGTQQYTMNDLHNLSDRKKEEFAKVLDLNVSEDNFLERLIRILGFLGLITYDYTLYGLIVNGMDYKTIKSLCVASKDLGNICKHEGFWENLYNDRYGKLTIELKEGYEKLFIIREIQEDFLPYPIKAMNIKIKDINNIALDLTCNRMGDKGAEVIGKSLEINTSVTKLILRNNRIGDKGAETIGKSLETNTSLIELDLYNNQIGDRGAETIGKSLRFNNSLTGLNLDYNKIGDKGAEAIGKSLRFNNSLTGLNLDYNKIGFEGGKAIGKSLRFNTSLTELNLSFNQIGDEGAIAIGKSLEINTSLVKLNLSYNLIGDEGAKAIGKGLKTNSSLTLLYLSNNGIGDKGAEEIRKSLETNTTLNCLSLRYNQIDQEMLTEINLFIEENNEL